MVRKPKGFTLIELLVVIAILSILLVIVLVAINPAKQTRDARNSQRQADVLTILNAVNQHFIETTGFPTGSPSAGGSPLAISDTGTGQAFCEDLVPVFVAELSFDPSNSKFFTDCTDYDTGYTIEILSSSDRTKISAPSTEGNIATISATR